MNKKTIKIEFININTLCETITIMDCLHQKKKILRLHNVVYILILSISQENEINK